MFDGIKIYHSQNRPGQVMLSSGTEKVTVLNGKPAMDPTFVPREPWRLPTAAESKQLLGRGTNPDYQSIGVVQLPPHLVKLWKRTGVHTTTTESEIQSITLKPDYAEAVKSTGQWASSYQRTKEQMIVHNLACIPKGLRTVTYNPKEQRYLGLHLDSWEKKPLSELATVRNRLCINMGQSPRYFLFVNQEIQAIQRILDQPLESRARVLIQQFLSEFPDYPVVRIQLEPFEAYIAPTENLIHDGSSENQSYQDVQITLRSYFGVYPQTKSLIQKVRHFFYAS